MKKQADATYGTLVPMALSGSRRGGSVAAERSQPPAPAPLLRTHSYSPDWCLFYHGQSQPSYIAKIWKKEREISTFFPPVSNIFELVYGNIFWELRWVGMRTVDVIFSKVQMWYDY